VLWPGVHPSQVSILSKWLNLGSSKQCPGFCDAKDICDAKISGKLEWYHHQWGLKMQVGYVNIGDFRPVSCYISEMVQDCDS